MSQRRGLAYLFGVILFVIAPTAISLGWYALSENPNLRPLAITKQSLAAYNGENDGIEIVALVNWGAEAGGEAARSRFARDLATSFAAKGVEVRIRFEETRGNTGVTYEVGETTLGPFERSRAAEGINAAVEAFKMH